MNTRKAARAAGAGLLATGVFLAALLVVGAAVALGFLTFSAGAGTGNWWVVALVIVFALIAGGSLPARALGAEWWRSLMVSGVTVGVLALATPPLVANAEGLFALFYLFAFVAPALIAIGASAGNGLTLTGLFSVIGVATLFFVVLRLTGFLLIPGVTETSAAFVQGAVMVAAGWALLPALAGIFQRPPDEV